MEHLKEFENSILISKLSLFASGINIFPNEFGSSTKLILSFIFYFNFFWLYGDVIPEFAFLIVGIQNGKSFAELTAVAPCTCICLLATAKSTPLYYYRNLLFKVANKLRALHPNLIEEVEEHNATETNDDQANRTDDMDTKKERIDARKVYTKIIEEATKFLNFVNKIVLMSIIFVIGSFSSMPLVAMYYQYKTTGEMDLKLPFPTLYFFDPFTKTSWPLTYFHQVISTVIVCLNVFGTDMFLYAFCSYIHVQFGILSHRYENMVTRHTEETRRRLKNNVKRHQELIKMVDEMELIYSKATLFNILSSSLLICLSGFNVTFGDELGVVIQFSFFLTMSLTQIYILCHFGDMLMKSSTDVGNSVYKCRWYDADESTKKNIIFVISRTQKPCKLTAANFANVNLSAFTTILSRSWSYFALLRTMFD